MQQKEPNASTFFHQYLPTADVSLVKLLLAVREIHTAVTLNICSVVVICKSASLGHVIIWLESRAASYSHVQNKCTRPLKTEGLTVLSDILKCGSLNTAWNGGSHQVWLLAGISLMFRLYVPDYISAQAATNCRIHRRKCLRLLEGRRKMQMGRCTSG